MYSVHYFLSLKFKSLGIMSVLRRGRINSAFNNSVRFLNNYIFIVLLIQIHQLVLITSHSRLFNFYFPERIQDLLSLITQYYTLHLIQQIPQSIINNHLSLKFLLHVSITTRLSSGRYTQRYTSRENSVTDVRVQIADTIFLIKN